jgi:hypothetical protein
MYKFKPIRGREDESDEASDTHKRVRRNIVENTTPEYVVKVTDVEYSTLLVKDNERCIAMPGTWPWHAPEWAESHIAANITYAKKMDAYWFGMVCVWMLFYNTHPRPNHSFTEDLDSSSEMLRHVDTLLRNCNLPQRKVDVLSEFFSRTLTRVPSNRTSDFQCLLSLLS